MGMMFICTEHFGYVSETLKICLMYILYTCFNAGDLCVRQNSTKLHILYYYSNS